MSEKDKNKDEGQFGSDKKGKTPLGMPKNYFDSFGARLFNRIDAHDELSEFPLLSSIKKTNPFAVPADYFEWRGEMLHYLALREHRSLGFITPENYFGTLPMEMLSAVEREGELHEHPLLAAAEKKNPFAIPPDYFSELSSRLKDRAPGARVIPIYTKIWVSYRMTIAAAVAIIVSLSFLFYYYQDNTALPAANECKSVACLSTKEILNSNVIQNMSEDNIIELIDEKNLSDSLLLKSKGKAEKIDVGDVSEEVDMNTITEEM